MDLNIIRHPDLKLLMHQGVKFRENVRVNALDVVNEALQRFTATCARKFEIPSQQFAEWAANVRAQVAAQLPPPLASGSILDRPDVKRALTRLRRLLVLTMTDKADKNFTLVCQNLYKHTLMQELQTQDGAYETVNLTPQEVYQNYSQQLLSGKCPRTVKSKLQDAVRSQTFRLPLLYWLPKMHKTPPKARFIAASSDIMTTPLAKALTPMLMLVKRELKVRDEKHRTESGVSRCWFVNSYDEVAQRIRQSSDTARQRTGGLQTFDFSTMYTTLDLEELVGCVQMAIAKLLAIQEMISHTIATWSTPASITLQPGLMMPRAALQTQMIPITTLPLRSHAW
jgi:hypothetical protein